MTPPTIQILSKSPGRRPTNPRRGPEDGPDGGDRRSSDQGPRGSRRDVVSLFQDNDRPVIV